MKPTNQHVSILHKQCRQANRTYCRCQTPTVDAKMSLLAHVACPIKVLAFNSSLYKKENVFGTKYYTNAKMPKNAGYLQALFFSFVNGPFNSNAQSDLNSNVCCH